MIHIVPLFANFCVYISILTPYLYYYDVPGCKEVAEKITKIFNKHGFYYEFGTNWYLYAEPNPKKESN